MSQGSPRLLLALLNIKLFYLYEVTGVKWIPPFSKILFGDKLPKLHSYSFIIEDEKIIIDL
jgi:hypothetical protein